MVFPFADGGVVIGRTTGSGAALKQKPTSLWRLNYRRTDQGRFSLRESPSHYERKDRVISCRTSSSHPSGASVVCSGGLTSSVGPSGTGAGASIPSPSHPRVCLLQHLAELLQVLFRPHTRQVLHSEHMNTSLASGELPGHMKWPTWECVVTALHLWHVRLYMGDNSP